MVGMCGKKLYCCFVEVWVEDCVVFDDCDQFVVCGDVGLQVMCGYCDVDCVVCVWQCWCEQVVLCDIVV